MYVPVKIKFSICLIIASSWLVFCFWLSLRWIFDLAEYITLFPALLIVFSIALIPGFMYMFLLASYLLDKRERNISNDYYPPITILIAAYNEEESIAFTLAAINQQQYPNTIETILIDDGSTDNTLRNAKAVKIDDLSIIQAPHGGKANALNAGLALARFDWVITLDADTYLLPNAIQELVDKLFIGPEGTIACAGSVYVKNSRQSLMTKIQEWDYFHAIAVIKRSQSLFQGTLVAQGAFSIYQKKALKAVGGWPNLVGEDIVLTWALLNKGYRIDFAEKAISFTSAPVSYRQFFHQRSRWARGLVEAFVHYPRILRRWRLSTFYIYWNLFFILFDTVFFFVFMPGLIAALFGYYYIAGPMTLAVIPLAFFNNIIFFIGQRDLFKLSGLKVRKNLLGFIFYILFYQFLMNPAVIHGYVSELARQQKTWGTK
ncbi:glycosyltransferase [Legionella cardiaca]|uniref:Glycosyltransferase n=1 Tax=Legionella cardiaca TaxID=1071983 RepID=A0ABY8ARB2_9GAMM|nr:glycosyltransferase [Legionella cardiaca]WED43073.1 glycosyltransferase [Legionella cardiaca]